MKVIQNWVEQKGRCYFCGETRSVKYKIEVFNPVEDTKLISVYACNKCALMNRNKLRVRSKENIK